MKNIIKVILITMSVILPSKLLAETEYSLQINGLSWHSQERAYDGTEFNWANIGIGLQVTQSVIGQPNNFIHWTVGGLKNSLNDLSGYAGGAVVRRWGDNFRFEAGLFIGAMSYPTYEKGFFLASAPFLSFGTNRVGVNVMAVPPIGDLPAFVFLQLRLGFKGD